MNELMIARIVAEHWRDAAMSSQLAEERVPWRMAAHPLALVLLALDGETDPTQLGVDGRAAERIRELIASDRHPSRRSNSAPDLGVSPPLEQGQEKP